MQVLRFGLNNVPTGYGNISYRYRLKISFTMYSDSDTDSLMSTLQLLH